MPLIEINASYPSEIEEEFIDLARTKAGRNGTNHYVIPSTEQVLEVHDHVTRGIQRVTTTIIRDREPTHRFADPYARFQYSQKGRLDRGTTSLLFSDAGVAIRIGTKRTLRTTGGMPLCYPRDAMMLSAQPTDEELAGDLALMKSLGKGDRIIFQAFFPSHEGKTRKEIKQGKK
jgi:hypothetical protein